MQGSTVHYIPLRRPDNEDNVLHCDTLVFSGIDMNLYAMILAPGQTCKPFANNIGTLLLPRTLTFNYMNNIDVQCKKPTIVVYDQYGRIRSMILSSSNYLLLEKAWSPPEFKTALALIKSIDHQRHMIETSLSHFEKLLLPPNRPPEFNQWIPDTIHGEYEIMYDQHRRIFHIKRNDGTNIILESLWEPRYTMTSISSTEEILVEETIEDILVDRF